MNLLQHIFKRHAAIAFSVLVIVAFAVLVKVFAAPPPGGFLSGSELDPDCQPGDTDCFVASGSSSPFEAGSGTESAQLINTVDDPNDASGAHSLAIGSSQSEGDYSFASGFGNVADANYSLVFGRNATITGAGEGSVLFGLDGNGYTVSVPNAFSIMGGNTGVGTVDPQAVLDVYNSVDGGDSNTLVLSNSGSTVDSSYAIAFSNQNAGDFVRIVATDEDTEGPSHLSFWTKDNSSILQERLTILNNGNVGIGTSAPAEKLEINGGALINGDLSITGTCTGCGGGSNILEDSITLTPTQVNSLNTSPITFIPAPGAGKAIDIISAEIKINFATTAYDTNNELDLITDTSGIPLYTATSLFTTSSVFENLTKPANNSFEQLIENKAILIKSPGADPQNGDSPVTIYVAYRIINL